MSEIIGSFGEYEVPEKENQYVDTIKALAEATAKNPKSAWTVELPAKGEQGERSKIANAANAIGKTASLKSRDDSNRIQIGTHEKSGRPMYDGTVKLTFVLVPQHKPRKGVAAHAEAPADTEAKTK